MKMHVTENWLRKKIAEDDEPSGCIACGAIAGSCSMYPNCLGNPEWRDPIEDLDPYYKRKAEREAEMMPYLVGLAIVTVLLWLAGTVKVLFFP